MTHNKKYTPLMALALATATTSQAALTTDLVAYYDFDEVGAAGLTNKAPGASGTDATWTNAPTNGSTGFSGNAAFNPGDGVSDRSTLLVGNAVNFVDGDGNNSVRVSIPFSSTDLGSTFTISAWTYLAPGASNGSNRFQAIEASNNFDVSRGTAGNYSTTGRDDYLGYVETTAAPTFSGFAEEEWDHVILEYDTSGANPTVSIYVNGSLSAVTATDTSGAFSFDALHLGGSRNGAAGDRDWDGMMDEVAIWNRALTQAERTQAYNLGLGGQALTSVPEPSSAALLGLGGLALILRRRK